jgi:DNA (cytosine-5)-methyltransferase 1
LMAERGWRGAGRWKTMANEVAPTLVGGSRKHGGQTWDLAAQRGLGRA